VLFASIALPAFVATSLRADVPGTMPLVAADGGHIWWVVERAPAGASGQASDAKLPFLLMHHASVEPAPTERLVTRLAREPEAIVAGDNMLVVVARAEGSQPRMVLALEAERNAVTGLWYSEPRTGPRILPPLPAEGLLRDTAIANGVAYALIRRSAVGANDAAGESASIESASVEPASVEPASVQPTSVQPSSVQPSSVQHWLGRLDLDGGDRWETTPLPPLDLAETIRLSDAGGQLRAIGVAERNEAAAVTAAGASHAVEAILGSTGKWTVQPLVDGNGAPIAARGVLGAIEVAGAFGLVERVAPLVDGGPATVRLSVVRGGVTNGWASFPEPAEPWALAGFGSEAILLSLDKDRRGIAQTIAPTAAVPSDAVTLAPPGFTARNWVHIPILAILSVGLALAAVIFGADAYLENRSRGGVPRAPIPANRRRGARLGLRAAAAGIDLVPGLAIAWFVFGGPILPYLQFPIFVTDASIGAPAFLAFAIGWFVASVGDVLFGRSVGKRLMGLEIIGVRGDQVSASRRFVRALAASVTWASPIVMLLAALNPRGDGPSEMVSGTAVVEVEGEPAGDSDESRRDADDDSY
jgi:uncharacterized RDD family membrane protein YckC